MVHLATHVGAREPWGPRLSSQLLSLACRGHFGRKRVGRKFFLCISLFLFQIKKNVVFRNYKLKSRFVSKAVLCLPIGAPACEKVLKCLHTLLSLQAICSPSTIFLV